MANAQDDVETQPVWLSNESVTTGCDFEQNVTIKSETALSSTEFTHGGGSCRKNHHNLCSEQDLENSKNLDES
jgi:hypothetical protein